jgi:hypothetical protein
MTSLKRVMFLLALPLMGSRFGQATRVDFAVPAARSAVHQNSPKQLDQGGLRSADLPVHFQPAPPLIEHFISKGIQAANQHPGQDGLTIDQVSSFVNFKESAIVTAIMMTLADQRAIEKFDVGLRKADLQEVFIAGFKKSLSPLGSVKVTTVKEISPLVGIGHLAKGFNMTASVVVGGLPVKLTAEAIALRRENRAVLIILATLNNSLKGISAQQLALRLDQRLRSARDRKYFETSNLTDQRYPCIRTKAV